MRKELPNTYTYFENGEIGIRARTPNEEIIEYDISANKIISDLKYTDGQGTPKIARLILKPVMAGIINLDELMPSDLHLFYLAASVCYSGDDSRRLIEKTFNADEAKMKKLVGDVVRSKHLSVVEHRPPSFLVEGISRACSHQLVRHRLFTFSQQSQRYVDVSPGEKGREELEFPFVIPPSVRADPEMVENYLLGIRNAISSYLSLRNSGALPEDARFLLPNAAATRLVISGNERVWLEFIPKRTCARAQWEIDMLATEIAQQLYEKDPVVFGDVGPACSLGKCDQGRRTCGYPLNRPLCEFFEDFEYPHDKLIFGMK